MKNRLKNGGRRNILSFREEKYFLYSREKENDGLSRRQIGTRLGKKAEDSLVETGRKKNEYLLKQKIRILEGENGFNLGKGIKMRKRKRLVFFLGTGKQP